jgi:hypothetical protein
MSKLPTKVYVEFGPPIADKIPAGSLFHCIVCDRYFPTAAHKRTIICRWEGEEDEAMGETPLPICTNCVDKDEAEIAAAAVRNFVGDTVKLVWPPQ